jgi:hypothetical protein
MAGAIRRAKDIVCNRAKSRVTDARGYSTTDAGLIQSAQQIGRIRIDASRAGAFQFFLAVTAGQQPYAKRPGASRCTHGIADHQR